MKVKKITAIFLVLVIITVTGGVQNHTNICFAASESEISENAVTEDTVSEDIVSENAVPVDLGLSAPSYILMESSTGTVITEKNADEVLRPASITKIMTLILIFDALKAGKINLSDEVTVSEYASSMGGSQVFLETGEKQSVETMIKCIAVASANDACVAMAEFISGSEKEFVNQMNERAKGLNMDHTFFMNCNGLDTDGHVTTARDVAIMSRELISKYPEIHQYSTIWMEDITHTTAKGSTSFGLANTNKLIRQYEYATGLKTGSTGLAKYCVSATAKKDDIEMLAVVMAAPDPKARFHDATTLLEYGYSVSKLYQDENQDLIQAQIVKGGVLDEVPIVYEGGFTFLSVQGEDLTQVKKEIRMEESVEAPVKKGEKAGEAVYMIGNKRIGSVPLLYAQSVRKAKYQDCLKSAFHNLLL